MNVDDLLLVIAGWGPYVITQPCPADIVASGGFPKVDIDDLLAVITAWGACD